jgi:hypothetical protein
MACELSPADNAHKLRHVLELSRERTLRVSLLDGQVFRLRGFSIVDHSVYGGPGTWCADVVEAVSGTHPDFKRLHRPGNFLDLAEAGIAIIQDDSTGQVLHESQ